MLSDKTLRCVECGSDFTFTVGEQEFFASRGFTNEPSRCPQCRAARRSQQGGSGRVRRFRRGTTRNASSSLRSVRG